MGNLISKALAFFNSFGGLERYGRRFILSFGSLIISTLLLLFSYIDQQVWLTAILSTTAVYIGAGTYQKKVEAEHQKVA